MLKSWETLNETETCHFDCLFIKGLLVAISHKLKCHSVYWCLRQADSQMISEVSCGNQYKQTVLELFLKSVNKTQWKFKTLFPRQQISSRFFFRIYNVQNRLKWNYLGKTLSKSCSAYLDVFPLCPVSVFPASMTGMQTPRFQWVSLQRNVPPLQKKKRRKDRSSHKARLSWEVSTVGFQPKEASTSYTLVCIFCVMFVRMELSVALITGFSFLSLSLPTVSLALDSISM